MNSSVGWFRSSTSFPACVVIRSVSAWSRYCWLLFEAAYTRNKQPALQRANFRLELARHLWRLAHELEAISTRRYAHGAKLIDELAR